MSKAAARQTAAAVVVLAAGREATLERCLQGLARQQAPDDFVVTVVDSAPSGGASEVALRHEAVHWVVLTGQVGLVGLCHRGLATARFERIAVIDAAYIPEPGWLAGGLALLDRGVELAIGPPAEGGFADMFLVRSVFDRIGTEGEPDGEADPFGDFVRRCEAAGLNVSTGAPSWLCRGAGASSGRAGIGQERLPTPGLAPVSVRRCGRTPVAPCRDLISVVVCSGGRRPEQLQRCLRSLTEVDDPNFEIILVDNAAVPSMTHDQLPAGVKHVREPRRGLDRARNRGVMESAGDIIAFVDDDCEAHRDWLTGIREAFADPLVSFVTGRVRPARLSREAEQWFEARFPFDRGPCPARFTRVDFGGRSPLLAGELGTGANMAFRRTLCDRLGGFDVNLDMGTLIGGGGDLDIFARALEEDAVGHYAPDAVVFHHHRDNLADLRWQTWGYGVCQGAMCAKYLIGRPGRRLHAILRYMRLLRERQHQLAASQRGDDRYPLHLARLELLGVAVGPLAYVTSVVHQRHGGRR
jgi:GT2 family glycosyltransferase